MGRREKNLRHAATLHQGVVAAEKGAILAVLEHGTAVPLPTPTPQEEWLRGASERRQKKQIASTTPKHRGTPEATRRGQILRELRRLAKYAARPGHAQEIDKEATAAGLSVDIVRDLWIEACRAEYLTFHNSTRSCEERLSHFAQRKKRGKKWGFFGFCHCVPCVLRESGYINARGKVV